MQRTLLLVDDKNNVLHALARVLNNEGYKILTAKNGQEGLQILTTHPVQVIISNQQMPNMTGLEFLSQVKKLYPQTIRIILNGYTDVGALKDAINEGAIYKFLNKPWDADLLRQHIREAFHIYELQTENKQIGQILEDSLEGVMITSPDDIVQEINSAFTKITGYSAQEVVGSHFCLLNNDSNNPDISKIKNELMRIRLWRGEVWSQRKNGTTYPIWISISANYDEDKNIIHYIYLFLDITQQKQNERQLTQMIYFDKLTGLHNRLFFAEHLSSTIEKAQKSQKQLAIFYIDIDRFSSINNDFGQRTGDQLLQETASRLKKWVRRDDDVARLGNDEFAILLASSQKIPIETHIHELIKKLKAPFSTNGRLIYFSTSIGVSLYPQHTSQYDLLIKYANAALLHSKELGGDNFQIYNETMASIQPSFNLESDLHQALEKQQFVLYYQPIVASDTAKVVCIEALLRWQHPQYGLLLPEKFISLCETTGLIIPIGEWVLRTACQQLMQWRKMGYHALSIAVNLSARQFNDPKLHEMIVKVLNETHVPAHYLKLEITESIIMQNIETNITLLQLLRNLGLQLSLDDFGTGYSSLSYLKRFPFNILKVDKSFIQGMALAHNNSIVEAIIAMAKSLNLAIVAEGVETQEQLSILQEKKCDFIQGYLYSMPITADELTKRLAVGFKKQ